MQFDPEKLKQIAQAAAKLHEVIMQTTGKDAIVGWAVMEDGTDMLASGASYTVGCPGDRFTHIREKIKTQLDGIPLVQDPVGRAKRDGTLKQIPVENFE